jgi:hypothetical protein
VLVGDDPVVGRIAIRLAIRLPAAGIVKVPTRLEVAKKAFEKLTAAERKRFLDWCKEVGLYLWDTRIAGNGAGP